MAQNNSTTNYLRLAYLQRLSLKLVSPDIPYAVVTDQASLDSIPQEHAQMFDHVILLTTDWAQDQEWKQRNDWQLAALTPFNETIKVETDLLFTRAIDHWFTMLRHRDVVLSLGCRNYLGDPAASRKYRQVFDSNNLPDTYSGLMYWRNTVTANNFFQLCKRIYKFWDLVKQDLAYCDDPGSNDLVFSIAARCIGEELVTLPAADFFNITHMKPAINGKVERKNWLNELHIELDPPYIRVNGQDQTYPFHYQNKNWVTDEMIRKYEHAIRT
jgi:hypothetical protein